MQPVFIHRLHFVAPHQVFVFALGDHFGRLTEKREDVPLLMERASIVLHPLTPKPSYAAYDIGGLPFNFGLGGDLTGVVFAMWR